MTENSAGSFPYGRDRTTAPRSSCPCVWDWIANTKEIADFLVRLLILILAARQVAVLVGV